MVAVSPWPLFWRLCRLGTLRRENSLTVRSAGCRVPREGWAWGSFVLQLERGVGFQQAGLGEGSLPSRRGGSRLCEPMVPTASCRELGAHLTAPHSVD